MKTRAGIHLSCLLALGIGAQPAIADRYGSGWYREVQLAITREDNVPRAYQAADIVDDTITSASFGLGYIAKSGAGLEYTLGGYIDVRRHRTVDDLSHTAMALEAALVWQPDVGFDAPWLRVAADVTRFDYENSDIREGYLLRTTASLHRRLPLGSSGRLGYRYLEYVGTEEPAVAGEANPFDATRHELFAGIDVPVFRSAYVAAEYGYQRGDATTSSWGTMSVDFSRRSTDTAFSQCGMNSCGPYTAYRSDADLHRADLGLVFPVGSVDIDVTLRYFEARTDSGPSYDNRLLQIGLIRTF